MFRPYILTIIGWKNTEGKCYRRDLPFKTELLKYITFYSPKTSNKNNSYWWMTDTRGRYSPNSLLFCQQTDTYPHMTQMNPANTIATYFFMIHFKSILPSVSRSSNFSLSFKFPKLNSLRISLLHHHVSHDPHISFIHSVICLTTGPTPLPKRFLHIVRSRASSFKW